MDTIQPNPALRLPSNFQIGDAVYVAATVVAVRFGDGQVNYECVVGTHAELPPQPNVVARSYDVKKYQPDQEPSASEPALR